MNFSYEELYFMYGRYDTNITINFLYHSNSFKQFGASLMGTVIYTEDERRELEEILKKEPVPRTDRKIRLLPSSVIALTEGQFEQAERFGFQCSDIFEILSYNKPRENRFVKKGEIELEAGMTINMTGWNRQNVNQTIYGFLDSRFSNGRPLSPHEINKYLALRNYFHLDNSQSPYRELVGNSEKEIRFQELHARYIALIITKEEIEELGTLIADKYSEREKQIQSEIERSVQKISQVAKKYGDELNNLKKVCHGFDEEILLFGNKIIYLDFPRFLHIYARHVTETNIGGDFKGKTVFQYKFDDIIKVIKLVIDSEAKAIQEHFKQYPEKDFKRLGKRAIYYDGHYYRVDIDKEGKLVGFHPYNNNDDKDQDLE